MLCPGFEPGLPRPQRGVLTTRLTKHCCLLFGGAGLRSRCLVLAKHALYQLSYTPLHVLLPLIYSVENVAPTGNRTRTSCLGGTNCNHSTIGALWNVQYVEVQYTTTTEKRIGAAEARWAHNPKVRGSKPRFAMCSFLFVCLFVCLFKTQKKEGHDRDRTGDPRICNPMLYHWATYPCAVM